MYAVALTAESLYQHDRYTTGFDTAVFDQALWLLADGEEPLSTMSTAHCSRDCNRGSRS